MDECVLEINDHPGTSLELRDLNRISIIDCTKSRHIEEVIVSNCESVEKIVFCDGSDFRSAARSILFKQQPGKSVYIDGLVGSIGYQPKGGAERSWIGAELTPSFLKFEVGDGALFTSSLTDVHSACNRQDTENILFFPKDDCDKHIRIGNTDFCPFTHFGINGQITAPIESIHIDSPDIGLQVITLRNLPELCKLTITGHVRRLEIDNCPKIVELLASGDHLDVISSQRTGIDGRKQLVKTNGVWMDVQGVQLSDSTVIKSDYLRTGADLFSVKLRPFDYQGGCDWSQLLDLELEVVMDGIPLPEMIERIRSIGPHSLNELEDWFVRLPYLSQQYFALRLVTALSFDSNFPREDIWRGRDNILASNRMFENARAQSITHDRNKLGSSESQDWFMRHLSAKKRRENAFFKISKELKEYEDGLRAGFRASNNSHWYVPEEGWIPFQRLDTEIWVQTGGVSLQHGVVSAHELFNRVPMEEIVVSIEIMQSKRDTVQQEKRQEELVDSLFEKLKGEPIADFYDRIAGCILVCDEGLQDLLIPRIVTALKDADIGLIPIAAISAALLQVTDNPELRIFLSRARSSPEVTSSEARTLHALAMSGQRAFASGLIPPLSFPIIGTWRNIHDKK